MIIYTLYKFFLESVCIHFVPKTFKMSLFCTKIVNYLRIHKHHYITTLHVFKCFILNIFIYFYSILYNDTICFINIIVIYEFVHIYI